jgi:hypothetical protein
MNLSRNVGALVLLVALALVGSIVLLALGHTVPDYITLVVVTGVGALAGVALPTGVAADSSTPAADLASLLAAIAGHLGDLVHHTPAAPVASPLPPAAPATDTVTTVTPSATITVPVPPAAAP